MFPLKDENPTEITPFVTVAIIAVNVLVWVMLQNVGVGQEFLESLADKPPFRADPTILPQTPTSDIGRYVNRTIPKYSANPTLSRARSPKAGSSRA